MCTDSDGLPDTGRRKTDRYRIEKENGKMITILKETTRTPITLMGERAGVCWGADISKEEKNYKRGL